MPMLLPNRSLESQEVNKVDEHITVTSGRVFTIEDCWVYFIAIFRKLSVIGEKRSWNPVADWFEVRLRSTISTKCWNRIRQYRQTSFKYRYDLQRKKGISSKGRSVSLSRFCRDNKIATTAIGRQAPLHWRLLSISEGTIVSITSRRCAIWKREKHWWPNESFSCLSQYGTIQQRWKGGYTRQTQSKYLLSSDSNQEENCCCEESDWSRENKEEMHERLC